MASEALANLRLALQEVRTLQGANPTRTGMAPQNPQLTRVVGRASVVLLSSHFERYFYAVNEEAINAVVVSGSPSDLLPVDLRLVHTRPPIDDLLEVQWNRRQTMLERFAVAESSLWIPGAAVTTLDHRRFLRWMTAPDCKSIRRYYKMWGIQDIFTSITRSRMNRDFLWYNLAALVEKRNNIAHGDWSVEATQADVVQYMRAVNRFCESADNVFARKLRQLFHFPRPW